MEEDENFTNLPPTDNCKRWTRTHQLYKGKCLPRPQQGVNCATILKNNGLPELSGSYRTISINNCPRSALQQRVCGRDYDPNVDYKCCTGLVPPDNCGACVGSDTCNAFLAKMPAMCFQKLGGCAQGDAGCPVIMSGLPQAADCKAWALNPAFREASDAAITGWCAANPTRIECQCDARASNKDYQKVGPIAGISDSCWYLPCRYPLGQLLTSSERNQICPENVCNRVLDQITQKGIGYQEVLKITGCSPNGFIPPTTPVPDLSGGLTAVPGDASGTSLPTIAIVFIVIGVLLLVAGICYGIYYAATRSR